MAAEKVLPGIESRLDFYFAGLMQMLDAMFGGKKSIQEFFHPAIRNLELGQSSKGEEILAKANLMRRMFPERFRKADDDSRGSSNQTHS